MVRYPGSSNSHDKISRLIQFPWYDIIFNPNPMVRYSVSSNSHCKKFHPLHTLKKPSTQEEATRNTSSVYIQRWKIEGGSRDRLGKLAQWKSTGSWSEGQRATGVQAEQRKWICLLLGRLLHHLSPIPSIQNWPNTQNWALLCVFSVKIFQHSANHIHSCSYFIPKYVQQWPGVQWGSTWRRWKLARVNRLWSGMYLLKTKTTF